MPCEFLLAAMWGQPNEQRTHSFAVFEVQVISTFVTSTSTNCPITARADPKKPGWSTENIRGTDFQCSYPHTNSSLCIG